MRFGRRPADRGVSPPACRGVRSRPADRGVFGRTRDRGVPPSDEPWGFQASVPLPRGDSGGVTRPGGEVAGVVPCPRARGGRLARAPRRVTGGHLARSPGPTSWAPPVPPRRPSGVGRGHVGGRRMGERASPGRHVPGGRGGRVPRAPRRLIGGHLTRSPGPTPWAPPGPGTTVGGRTRPCRRTSHGRAGESGASRASRGEVADSRGTLNRGSRNTIARADPAGPEGVTAGRLKHDRPGQGESESITSTEGRGGRAPIRLASEDPKYTCAKGVVASFSREFRAPWVLCEKSVCGGKRVQHQDFPGGHPSQYCSGPSALNCGVLMGSGVLALV